MGFQQGLSGLAASSANLDVIGNNIANANTYGAKSSRAEFADLYANAIGGTSNAIGIGTKVAAVAQQFTQGTITTTGNPLDVAINGSGFFEVSSTSGAISYTRNGAFKTDNSGYIVNDQGQRLMGYPANAAGTVIPGTASALQMPTAGLTPAVTTSISMQMNLDATSAVTVPASGAPIDFADPTTYNNATSQTVYDAKGQQVALTYYFQKASTDTWNVYVAANGTPISTDASGNPAASTTITFPTNGGTPTAPVGTVALDIPSVTNSVGATTVPITGVALDVSGATQYGSAFGVTALSQDGYAAGSLTGVTFESTGVITATYSNGQTKPAGQLELATFRNPQGLEPTGGNAWVQTATSGDPIVGVPGSGNLGVLQAGALEASNVDLTAELVNMITAQRDYQANAQTIKTEDQIMQTIVNLR
jgi:flagellar hook protein FlgE